VSLFFPFLFMHIVIFAAVYFKMADFACMTHMHVLLCKGVVLKKEVWERRSHATTLLLQVNSRTLTPNIAHMQCQINVARACSKSTARGSKVKIHLNKRTTVKSYSESIHMTIIRHSAFRNVLNSNRCTLWATYLFYQISRKNALLYRPQVQYRVSN